MTKLKSTSPSPIGALRAMARCGVRPTQFLLTVSVARQEVTLWERQKERAGKATARRAKASTLTRNATGNGQPVHWNYGSREMFMASTSRFGIGQRMHSNRTPLGLHRIARKIGGDQPIGTVFKARVPVGRMEDLPEATIVHRILWLAGLEPGRNSGGVVDTFRRYIYIHGYPDERTLGRPMSCGCVHLGARDLVRLYDLLPRGTLVWIGRK